MVDIEDLNKIHNRYGLAIDTEENAKTYWVGDKLKYATTTFKVELEKFKDKDLNYLYKYYSETRDEIARLDTDIIVQFRKYMEELSEVAEKLAQENQAFKMKYTSKFQQSMPDIDLDEGGHPHFMPEPMSAKESSPYIEVPPEKLIEPPKVEPPKQPKPEPLPEVEPSDSELDEAMEDSRNHSEEEVVPTQDAPKPTREFAKRVKTKKPGMHNLKEFTPFERRDFVQRAYLATMMGTRTCGEVLRTFKRMYPTIVLWRSTVYMYCKKFGFALDKKDEEA